MTAVFRAALAALLLLGAPGALAQTRAPELDRAKAIRNSDPDAAERIVRGVLARKPNDYYALYHMGLIEDVRGGRIPAGPERVLHYQKAAEWLEKAKAVRAAQGVTDATIFNSLGVFYLYLGDLLRAEENFNLGLRYQAALTPASRGKLLNNIGYLQAVKGNTRQATAALGKAAEYGNPAAQTNLNRIPPVQAQIAVPPAPRPKTP